MEPHSIPEGYELFLSNEPRAARWYWLYTEYMLPGEWLYEADLSTRWAFWQLVWLSEGERF